MRVTTLLLTGGSLLAASSGALASGFQVNLTGQKNVGMGGTGTGLYLDASSQFFNPGAFAFAPTGVVGGINMAIPRISFRGAGGNQDQRTLDNKNVFPFSGFASYGPKDGKWRVGVGAYTPFGSELHYQKNWEGRYSLTDITLQSVFVQATAAYAITPYLSIGAGLVWSAYGNVNLQRDIPIGLQNGTAPHATLEGTAEKKFGYNLGIMIKPSDKFSIGFSYRSAIDAVVNNGTVTFAGTQNTAVSGSFTATNFNVTLPLPDVYSAGIGIHPTDKLTLAFDANLVRWSRYQSLTFNYTGGFVGPNTTSSTSTRQYQDAVTLRFGLQGKVTDNLTLRGGALYDFSCVKDGYVTPETPDSDRIGLSAGLSYAFGEKFGVDVSFLYEDFMQRSQTQQDLIDNGTTDRVAGTYKTVIYVPGVGVYYNF